MKMVRYALVTPDGLYWNGTLPYGFTAKDWKPTFTKAIQEIGREVTLCRKLSDYQMLRMNNPSIPELTPIRLDMEVEITKMVMPDMTAFRNAYLIRHRDRTDTGWTITHTDLSQIAWDYEKLYARLKPEHRWAVHVKFIPKVDWKTKDNTALYGTHTVFLTEDAAMLALLTNPEVDLFDFRKIIQEGLDRIDEQTMATGVDLP
jgi:hypothetical protein